MIRFLILFVLLILSSTPRAQEIVYSGLENPTSIYTTQDHLFVVESGKHRVLKLDHDGNVLEILGGLGSGDYQFDTPIDIDATNGLKIYVSDYQNDRIQVFDRRFQYLSTIQAPRGQRNFKPDQIVVNEFGELFVHEESSRRIFKFDENGSYVDAYSINGLVVSEIRIRDNDLELYDFENNIVRLMTSNGLLVVSYPIKTPIKNKFTIERDSIIKN